MIETVKFEPRIERHPMAIYVSVAAPIRSAVATPTRMARFIAAVLIDHEHLSLWGFRRRRDICHIGVAVIKYTLGAGCTMVSSATVTVRVGTVAWNASHGTDQGISHLDLGLPAVVTFYYGQGADSVQHHGYAAQVVVAFESTWGYQIHSPAQTHLQAACPLLARLCPMNGKACRANTQFAQ